MDEVEGGTVTVLRWGWKLQMGTMLGLWRQRGCIFRRPSSYHGRTPLYVHHSPAMRTLEGKGGGG
jgi:hypothetical protein